MTRTPQVIVSLTPSGGLKVELPGVGATRRSIDLRTSEAAETLLRILHAQVQGQTEIGLDGAPTGQQLRHWERHGTWPDARCRFCLAEGRIKPTVPRHKRASEIVTHGEVRVQRVAPRVKGRAKGQVCKRGAGELGL